MSTGTGEVDASGDEEAMRSRGSSLMSDALREGLLGAVIEGSPYSGGGARAGGVGGDDDAQRRLGGIRSSVYTLVSTMMGGGVLSLPYAMQEAGLLLGPLLLFVICLASRLSLWLVLTAGCSLRAASYEEMVALTLGRRWAVVVTVILLLLLWFVIVAYSILLGDLLGPVLAYGARAAGVAVSDAAVGSHGFVSLRTGAMLVGHAAVLPVTTRGSLSAMRSTTAISLGSTLLLALLISARSVAAMVARGSALRAGASAAAVLAPSGQPVLGALTSTSIISVSFLCHFNVLPVSEELARPSKQRFRKVVDRATAVAGVLYLCVGVLGCLQFTDGAGGVHGNILTNYDTDDALINVGRLGLSLTVSIGIALMVHPLRSAARRLLNSVRELKATPADARAPGPAGTAAAPSGMPREVLEALAIQSSGMLAAILIPEITVVWSFMGSTVCMLVGYVLPAACYLALRRWGSSAHRRYWRGAWALAVAGSALTVVCTASTLTQYSNSL